jgi:hypothetical protein
MAGLKRRITKLATKYVGFRRLGKRLWGRVNPLDGVPKGQIPGNCTLHRSLHEPIEYVVHIRSGALDDPKSSAHWLGWQVVPFPKFAVKLIERNAGIAFRHVVESFPYRSDLFSKCLGLRTLSSPFI